MVEIYDDEMEIWAGDYGRNIQLQCSIKGVPYNLNGHTLNFRVTDAAYGTLKVDGTAVPFDAENGLCTYLIQQNDFNQPDKLYYAAIIATKTGVEITFGGLKIRVLKKPPSGS